MIFGECFTNLDDYRREDWPTVFAAVPREGECVAAASGKILKVVRVTHYMKTLPAEDGDVWNTEKKLPRIRVELHRTV